MLDKNTVHDIRKQFPILHQTVYNKPFNKDDHEAITMNIPVFGEVKGGKVVYAYEEDRKKGADLRLKQSKK